MISIIIPALNEAKALPATLAAIRSAKHHALTDPRWARAWSGQQAFVETIVVDGGSIDRTCAIAREEAGVVVLEAPRGRARQMNAGARCARGDWLLFLHADTVVAPAALAEIAGLTGAVEVGCFTHRFSGDDWRLRWVSSVHNFRWRKTGVIYGDQGMFVRRSLFERLGGFPEVAVLEDVQFSERVLAHARPVMLPTEIVTDGRKFVQKGVWISFARCVAIVLCFRAGLPIPSRKFFEPVR